jgi:hypothetical protein
MSGGSQGFGDASVGGGDSSSGSSSTGGGSGGCPTYQALCGGQCIPTSVDPNNCGGCGVKCAAPSVCTGGGCASSCLPGLQACSGSCVDAQNDNANCGSCGHACPSKQGCSSGACVPAVGSASSAQCNGAGPPITLGTMTAGCLAQVTFTWALCSCKDVVCSDVLKTDGFDSTKGPYMPGGLGGGVGVDRTVSVSSLLDVGGTLWASASTGTSPSSQTTVREELHVGGPVSTSATMSVADDAFVDGNVSGNVQIGGTLHIPSGDTASGGVTDKAVVNEPVSVPPPCDCTMKGLLPIASWIATAKATNDNARIGLSPTALQNPAGDIHLDLPCGSYYLSGINSGNSVTVAAHGNTALFIDGNVSASSSIAFVLDPTAQFDVVIGGTIQASSGLVIGSPAYPALSRTYIGSMTTLDLSASGTIAGNVYAAYSPVSLSSDYVQYGALVAGDFNASGSAAIHYDRATVGGSLCPPPPPSGPDGGASGSDGGPGGTTTCGTCKDCGNQACINGVCGQACTSSSDCCAPLICVNGSCTILPPPR